MTDLKPEQGISHTDINLNLLNLKPVEIKRNKQDSKLDNNTSDLKSDTDKIDHKHIVSDLLNSEIKSDKENKNSNNNDDKNDMVTDLKSDKEDTVANKDKDTYVSDIKISRREKNQLLPEIERLLFWSKIAMCFYIPTIVLLLILILIQYKTLSTAQLINVGMQLDVWLILFAVVFIIIDAVISRKRKKLYLKAVQLGLIKEDKKIRFNWIKGRKK